MSESELSEDFHSQKHWSVGGFTISYPSRFFSWQKLVYAASFPLVALIANLAGKGFGENLASGFKAGADDIVFCPMGRGIFITGGALGHHEVLISLLDRATQQFSCHLSHCDAYGSGEDFQVKEWLEKWKAETAFNSIGYSLSRLLQSQGTHGSLQVRGRIADALSEPRILDSDVFYSDSRVDLNSNSIWVGETRVWNVEVRVNPELAPAFLFDEEPKANEQPIRANRAALPKDAEALKEWARQFLDEQGMPPKNIDFECWRSERGLSRASVRSLRNELPSELKRQRGERDS